MYMFLSEYHYLWTRKANKRVYTAIPAGGVRVNRCGYLFTLVELPSSVEERKRANSNETIGSHLAAAEALPCSADTAAQGTHVC